MSMDVDFIRYAQMRRRRHWVPAQYSGDPVANLVLTSRQVSSEARAMYYGNNTFAIVVSDWRDVAGDPRKTKKWMEKFVGPRSFLTAFIFRNIAKTNTR